MGPAPAGSIVFSGRAFRWDSGPTKHNRPMRQRLTCKAAIGSAILVLGLMTACGSRGTVDSKTLESPAEPGTTPSSAAPEACAPNVGAPRTIAYEELEGVDPNLTSLDVYGSSDRCEPRPVVVWVHGGGWLQGDKANDPTPAKAAWAESHGWMLVAVNYRLSQPGAGVTWPDHGEDVAAAVAYVLDHAGELGVDPSRLALMGHSAGGQLVSIVSVDPMLLNAQGHDRSDVRCLVALDTEGYDLVDRVGSGGDITDSMITNAFGSDPATWVAASPLQTLERVGGPAPDAVIVTRGLPRRQAQAQAFASALDAVGAEATVVVATGYSHADVNNQLGAAGETVVTPPVTSFLTDCLR